jgi:uncharacterized membrane protein
MLLGSIIIYVIFSCFGIFKLMIPRAPVLSEQFLKSHFYSQKIMLLMLSMLILSFFSLFLVYMFSLVHNNILALFMYFFLGLVDFSFSLGFC